MDKPDSTLHSLDTLVKSLIPFGQTAQYSNTPRLHASYPLHNIPLTSWHETSSVHKASLNNLKTSLKRRSSSTYSTILPIKSPSFCKTSFSAILINLTTRLPQSRDCSCYVSRPILEPPPIRLQKHIDLREYDFAHSPYSWHEPTVVNVTNDWSWILCWINPATPSHVIECSEFTGIPFRFLSFGFRLIFRRDFLWLNMK